MPNVAVTQILLSIRNNPENLELNADLIKALNETAVNNSVDLSNLKLKDTKGNSSVLQAAEITILFEALSHTTITSVNFSQNNMYYGKTALAEAIKNNTTLVELNLENNSIYPQGARAIADALKKNTTLRSLNLANNNIAHPTTCEANLVDVLKVNKTLKILDLRSNDLDSSFIISLIRSLTEFSLNKLIVGDETGAPNILNKNMRSLATFIRSIRSHLITPQSLVICMKDSEDIEKQASDKPFSKLLPAAFKYHKNTMQACAQGEAIAEHCPVQAVASLIDDYLRVPEKNLKILFLTTYRNAQNKQFKSNASPKSPRLK